MHRQDELTICGGSAMLGIQEYVLLHTYIFFFSTEDGAVLLH